MKYVITGGAGHISKPLTEKLLAAGHTVTVIGRSAANLEALTQQGAQAATGSIEDVDFLTGAFAGADAAYLMIPPNFAVTDWRGFQNQVADNYITALTRNNIKHIVLLSSIGAHMGNGAGPIDGLADFEQKLAAIPGIHVKALRPSYFMYNLLGQAGMLKHAQILGGNFGDTDEKLVLVHTDDIAEAAAEELLQLNFTGQTVRYVASDERHPREIAAVLGSAVDKPEAPWVSFTDEQAKAGMQQAGLSEPIADGYTALGQALRSGEMQADYWQHRPVLGKVKLEDLAPAFAAAYQQS